MPELHLRQPRSTYSACGPFTCFWNIMKQFKTLEKQLFQNIHDAAYSKSKDLARTTISEKFLKERASEIARNPKYEGHQRVLASMVKCFDGKTGLAASVNEELAEELHKPVIKKFKRRRVYARFKDNIWAADLNDFIKRVNESNCKTNKLWVDQGRGFYNKLIREWLDDNDILMYLTHNEGKLVIAERFIRTLKAKIYKK